MRIRRCAVLLIEPRETLNFDLDALLTGSSGLGSTRQWLALAPHLDSEVEIDGSEREALGAIGAAQWTARAALEAVHAPSCIEALLTKGLLISDAPEHVAMRAREERLRGTHWHPLAAAVHYFGRWQGVSAGEAANEAGLRTSADLVARLGAPPPHFHARVATSERIGMTRPEPSELDALLARRTTCRNFDRQRAMGAADFSRLLHTVFAAQAVAEVAPDSFAAKKTSPSGGGLHATEAYLLVQQVEGIAPGLYHYHAGDHALEPLPCEAGDAVALHALANRLVAGQQWFADAHVLVMLTPRFARSFWKYRNHAKAYRALILDVGHLSQTLYLTATELGLGAFVTSAINEVEIEQAFGLDSLEESPLAVCGFGWRASEKTTVEFDPLKQVWDD